MLFQSGIRKHNEVCLGIWSTQAPTAWDRLHQSRHLRVRESVSLGGRRPATILCGHVCILWGMGKFFMKSLKMVYILVCLHSFLTLYVLWYQVHGFFDF